MQSLGPLDQNYLIPPQVLAYIEGSENLDSDRGKALLQLAEDYTTAIEDLADHDLAISDARQILKSEFCVRFYFGMDARKKNSKIHALTLNSYETARLGIRLNTHISEALPYLPEPDQWKNECRFQARALHASNRT